EHDAGERAWAAAVAGQSPMASDVGLMNPKDKLALNKYLAAGPTHYTDMGKWLEFRDMPLTQMAGLTHLDLMRDYAMVFDQAHMDRARSMIQQAQNAVAAAKGSATSGGFEGAQLFSMQKLLDNTLIA